MSRIYVTLAAIGFCLQTYSQKNPLGFKSYGITLNVSGDESIVLSTKIGEVGIADSFNGPWRRIDPPSENGWYGPTLEGACFFNKDTGFVSGFIQEGRFPKHSIVYHTIDGGKNWKPVKFSPNGWVDKSFCLENGEAWLSVSGKGLAYTSDFGLHWNKIRFPGKKQSFTAMFFNQSNQGLIGAQSNSIYVTSDNGEHWISIPTPLDQNKYSKTNISRRPSIEKVAFYKDMIIVKQEDLLFFSRRNAIDWKWLPGFDDFFTDQGSTYLYLASKKKNFSLMDDKLDQRWEFEIHGTYSDVQCNNGKLFIITGSELLLLNSEGVCTSYSFRKKDDRPEPDFFGRSLNGDLGHIGNKIYLQKEISGKWDYICTLPIREDSLILNTAGNMILYRSYTDSLYYFDLEGSLVKSVSQQTMLAEFCNKGISKIEFFKGSRGCFHYYENELIYTFSNGAFFQPIEHYKGVGSEGDGFIANPESIVANDINQFVQKIPSLFCYPSTTNIDALGFSEKDYDQCKKDIIEFQAAVFSKNKNPEMPSTKFSFEKNNIDFKMLLGLVDSIKFIKQESLYPMLFSLGENWSTTSYWKGFRLINNKDEVIEIRSVDFSSNAFCFPWFVVLNGCFNYTANIDINNFLNKVYPRFLDDRTKVEALHSMVKMLYNSYEKNLAPQR